MENKYYLHISSVNLAQYYNCAIIKPAKYFESRSEDIQSKFPEYLLLSELKRSNKTDCSVELILTQSEKDKLIKMPVIQGLNVFEYPLPISRVSSIFFESQEQKDKIYTLINLSTAFLPKNIVKVFANEESFEYPDISLPHNLEGIDHSTNLKRYNSILGGLALMKLVREPYMNYSENYFSTLSFFNSVIEEQLSKYKKLNAIYHDAFIGRESFKYLAQYLTKEITEEDLNVIANSEFQKIKKDKLTGIYDLNGLEKATYIIAVLYSYGLREEGRKNKIDGLILNNFQKTIKQDKAEVIALCYGLNRGYSAFSNKYKNENNEQILKFELNSKLDYYTIESIYQYAINNVAKSFSFSYLDSWCPQYQLTGKKKSKNDYFILDVLVIAEKIKVGDIKWWSRFMSLFFQRNQEELFKPFMVSVFNKIKDDLSDEFLDEIESKDDELLQIKKERDELFQKVKEYEKKEVKNSKSKKESSLVDANPPIVEEIQAEFRASSKSDSIVIEELKQKIETHNKLLKNLSKQTKMSAAKELISDFNKKAITSDLFKNNP